MLKAIEPMKELERQAAQALRALLEQVPAITVMDVEQETLSPRHEVDVVAHIELFGRPHTLACEVKSTGQPRHVRTALLQLHHYVAHQERATTATLCCMEAVPADVSVRRLAVEAEELNAS